jgi:hypothetical protein
LRWGDVNGDKKADLVCFKKNGDVVIWISKGDGTFLDWGKKVEKFCSQHNTVPKLADLDGDGRADLICDDKTWGHHYVHLKEPKNNRKFIYKGRFMKDTCKHSNSYT